MAMTMWRMRGMMGGEAWRKARWVSSWAKAVGGVVDAVQRRG